MLSAMANAAKQETGLQKSSEYVVTVGRRNSSPLRLDCFPKRKRTFSGACGSMSCKLRREGMWTRE